MHEAIEIYRKAVLPLVIAICFVLLKRLVEKRRPALEDTNDVAWALITMSVGAATVYGRGWAAAQLASSFAWVALLALVLLINRSRRMRIRARGIATGDPITARRIFEACVELAAGLAAVVISTG